MTLQNLSEKYAALEGRRASVRRYLPERHRWRVFLIDVPYFQGGSGFLNVRPRSINELASRMPEMDVD